MNYTFIIPFYNEDQNVLTLNEEIINNKDVEIIINLYLIVICTKMQSICNLESSV